jgi:addiction module HigA family antidote
MRDISPIHPGEQLREEFMKPNGLSCAQLAEDIGVSAPRVVDIVEERQPVNGEMALRLARYFGTSARFWLDLQRDYDLDRAAHELGNRLDLEVKPSVDGQPYEGQDRRARPRLG